MFRPEFPLAAMEIHSSYGLHIGACTSVTSRKKRDSILQNYMSKFLIVPSYLLLSLCKKTTRGKHKLSSIESRR